MLPVLFDKTAQDFSTEGLGRLTDAISCTVREKLNGEFELTMEYPVVGVHFSEIDYDKIIVADAAQNLKRQAFRIYKISKPLNGKVTINAAHISYDLNYIPVEPFQATGFSAAAAGLLAHSLENNPFTISTHDITNTSTVFTLNTPKGCRACLGGSNESLAQSFSGSSGVEFTFDNFTVYADLHRGRNNGYELRYGKNITNLNQEVNIENTITGVLPIWHNQDNTVVLHGDIQYNGYVDAYPFHRTVVYDVSDKYETAPDIATLNQEGYDFVNQMNKGIPAVNIKISFVDLYGTSSYARIQPLEQVNMGDTVAVYFEPLKISENQEVIETNWNVLTGRYNSITIGARKNNIADTIQSNITEIQQTNNKLTSVVIRLDYEAGLLQSTIGDVVRMGETVDQHTSQLQQTSESLSGIFSRLTTVEGVTTEVSAWFTFDASGLTIGENGNNIQMQLGADSLDFIETSTGTEMAWVDANDGIGGTKISIGDPNLRANRWVIFTSSDGSHLRFTRHN